MTTASHLDPWVVLTYEVDMYFNMLATSRNAATFFLLNGSIRNAIAESTVLHARILCDLFSSEGKSHDNDIGFSDLFGDWEVGETYVNLKNQIAKMKLVYGNHKTKNSPCWQFNKMLAHLTKERGSMHSYEPALNMVDPSIRKIVLELDALKPGFTETIVLAPKRNGG